MFRDSKKENDEIRLSEINSNITKLEQQLKKISEKEKSLNHINSSIDSSFSSFQNKDFHLEDSDFDLLLMLISKRMMSNKDSGKIFLKRYFLWKRSINESLSNAGEISDNISFVHSDLNINNFFLDKILWKNENIMNSKPMNRRIVFTDNDKRIFLKKFENDPKNFIYISHDFKPCKDVVLFYYTSKKKLNLRGASSYYGYHSRKMAQFRIGLRTGGGNLLDRSIRKERNNY